MKNLLSLLTSLALLSACSNVRTEPTASPSSPTTREAPSLETRREAERRELEKPTDRPTPMTTAAPLYTYDGDVKRTLWTNPALLVEFAPDRTRKATLLSSGSVVGEPREEHRGVRLWPLASVADPDRLARSSNLALGSEAFSPVLHTANAAGTPKRALPGGVLVTLADDWSAAQIAAWLAGHDLTVERELPTGNNAFLVASPAGLASLELANRLFESGEVVAASPNWWHEGASR